MMVLLLIVNGSMFSLNVAIMLALGATLVAPAAGTLRVTVGGVTSGAVPVVNVQMASVAINGVAELPAKELPAKSRTLVVNVAV